MMPAYEYDVQDLSRIYNIEKCSHCQGKAPRNRSTYLEGFKFCPECVDRFSVSTLLDTLDPPKRKKQYR